MLGSDLEPREREREMERESGNPIRSSSNPRLCFLIREYSAMCVSIGWVNLSVSVERETGGEWMRTKRWYLYGGYGYTYTSSSLRPLHVAWALKASLVAYHGLPLAWVTPGLGFWLLGWNYLDALAIIKMKKRDNVMDTDASCRDIYKFEYVCVESFGARRIDIVSVGFIHVGRLRAYLCLDFCVQKIFQLERRFFLGNQDSVN